MQEFLKRIEGFSQKRLTLLAYELQRRVDELEAARTEPIAIVGIGCRFPGGVRDAASYWNLLRNGIDAIREVPSERWDIDQYYDADPDTPGKMSTRWGGFLDQVDRFDPQFFGIAPREAETMDPQQRLLLEVAWEALEHAAMSPDRLFGTKGGVFIGMSAGDYFQLMRAQGLEGFDAYTASGTAHSIASGRLSYTLGLQGASISVDTACSSSLVAIHQAIQTLRQNECDFALAGGVNLILNPDITIALSKSHMMAPDGRCKAFDASANGFVRGEGCGIIVLKRLSDAQADGDRIIALIRGSATNQDGRSNGLTAPNGPSQEAVLRDALVNARVTPDRVGYIEAHGTGTSLGDPIEVKALGAVFGSERSKTDPLLVGSVKTNIGHLEASAGVAGLIKVALALHHGELPPQLHFKDPNPFIPWEDLPITVTTQVTPWARRSDHPNVAGISSFGFSGTNAHVILEEAPSVEKVARSSQGSVASSGVSTNVSTSAGISVERPLHVLTVSARHPDALTQLAAAYEQRLAQGDDTLQDIAYTANTGRAHFAHRMAVIAATRDAARARLAEYREGGEATGVSTGTKPAGRRPKIAFLFTGQGAQYIGMGRVLYDTQPVFRRALDRCAKILQPVLPAPLLSVLFPQQRTSTPIDETAYTQPALFAVEYALAQLWESWGIRPSAVAGHSIGEFTAACVAGVLSLEDALSLIAARGRLMGALPAGGTMAAIMADQTHVAEVIAPYSRTVSIAAVNGPINTVISGAASDVDTIARQFEQRGIKVTRLTVSHAFHSPLLDPMLDEFESIAQTVTYHAPEIDLISNVTGTVATSGTYTAAYWRDHARRPVQFATGVETLLSRGYDLFVEIGPQPTLLGMAQIVASTVTTLSPEKTQRWLPSLRKGRDDWEQLLDSMSALYVAGADIDWVSFDREYPRQKVVLPSYPFQRERYWLTERPTPVAAPESKPERISHLLYEVAWREVNTGGGEGRLSPADLAKDILPSIIAASAHNGFDQYAEFQPKLDQLSTAYIVQGLQRLGLDFTAKETITVDNLAHQLHVLPRHRTLLARLLDILTEDGILHHDSDGWRVARIPSIVPAAALCEALTQQYPAFAAELTLTERCGEELASVLRGETDPLQLLFPGGSLSDTEKLYRDSPASRTYNTAIAEVVRSIVVSSPKERPVRILEIGAGTGGTTSYVVPTLAGQRVEYTFTDVSPLFGARARDKFQEYPFMQYATLDIGRDPEAQGFANQSYDIILGSNVIHATADLEVTMTHVRQLLAPGGAIVLLEGTAPQRFGDLTVGLTDGWWAFTDTNRRSYALMPREQWISLFEETGFEEPVAIPGDDAGPALSQQAIFVARAGEKAQEASTWLLVSESDAMAQALAHEFNERGDHFIQVRADDTAAIRTAITTSLPTGIIYVGNLDHPLQDSLTVEQLRERQQTSLDGLLEVVHATASVSHRQAPHLWIVTRGAQPTSSHDSADAAQATLWGMSHVIAMEHPELRCTRIDLDPQSQDAKTLIRLVTNPSREDQIALRESRRLGRRLVRQTPPATQTHPTQISPDATYLVTGGLRGLGLRVAEWLVEQGARHLALMGRRPPDAATSAILRHLEGRGVTVYVATGDVSNHDDISRTLSYIDNNLPPLKGIIHAAGALDDGILTQLNWDRFETVLRPKVYGTWHLHTLTRNLDFLVIFSSGASLAGSAGQANHAAANAFEDALAHYRQAAGLPTLSINWGPWSDIGAAADREISARQFMDAISPEDGLVALKWAMRRDVQTNLFARPQVAVLPADWDRLLGQYSREMVPPLYEELANECAMKHATKHAAGGQVSSIVSPEQANGTQPHSGQTRTTTVHASAGTQQTAPHETRSSSPNTGAQKGETLHETIRSTTPNRRRSVLQDFVRAQAIKILGASSRERVDMTLPLRELGLDSLMAVELRNTLGKAVGRTLPATLTFDHPTVDALVDYLAVEVFSDEIAPASRQGSDAEQMLGVSPPDESAVQADALADTLNTLSEDDLAQLLSKQLDDLLRTDTE